MPVAEMAVTDKNTLETILVPWDKPVQVVDTLEDGSRDAYREGFRRTAFDMQVREFPETIRDVVLLPRHGSTETFGHARNLSIGEVGLHSVINVLPSKMDDVRSMVEQGIKNLSIEFHTMQKRHRKVEGSDIRWRDAAWLKNVAMTPVPAYEDAQVLAMRDLDALEKRKAARMATLDAELAELRAGGERWH